MCKIDLSWFLMINLLKQTQQYPHFWASKLHDCCGLCPSLNALVLRLLLVALTAHATKLAQLHNTYNLQVHAHTRMVLISMESSVQSHFTALAKLQSSMRQITDLNQNQTILEKLFDDPASITERLNGCRDHTKWSCLGFLFRFFFFFLNELNLVAKTPYLYLS